MDRYIDQVEMPYHEAMRVPPPPGLQKQKRGIRLKSLADVLKEIEEETAKTKAEKEARARGEVASRE